MSFFNKSRIAAALAGVALAGLVSAEAVAGPMSVTPARDLAVGSSVTDVKYTPKKRAPVRHARRGGGGAAAAAMMGVFAAGIGAAIANSRRDEYYERPSYGYYNGPAYSGQRFYSHPRYRDNWRDGSWAGAPYPRTQWVR